MHSFYGDSHVLQGVSFSVKAGQLLALLGRNGAGKSTCISTIVGFLPPRRGAIRLFGQSIARLKPETICRHGMAFVPQGRRVFASLTVRENLDVARRASPGASGPWTFDRVYNLFPRLRGRQKQLAGSLSGGEQQMLAIGRALMGNPKVLLFDEPSEGLAPLIVAEVGLALALLRSEGHSILLVEQNSKLALGLADEVVILTTGRCVFRGLRRRSSRRRDAAGAESWRRYKRRPAAAEQRKCLRRHNVRRPQQPLRPDRGAPAQGAWPTTTTTIDIHAHIVVPAAAKEAGPHVDLAKVPLAHFADAATKALNAEQEKDRALVMLDIDARLVDLDAMGVDIQVVAPAPPQCYYSVPVNIAERAHRIANEGVAEYVARRPERFVGLGVTTMQEPDVAVRDLETAITKLGLKGVQILTSVNGEELSDKKYLPFFAKAEELSAFVMMHPNGFTHADRLTHFYSTTCSAIR